MISKAWIFLFGLVFCVQSISSSPAAEPMNDGRWDEFWQQDLEDSDDIQTREAPQPATTAASQIDPAANVFTPLAESNVQAHLDAAGSHNGPNTRSVDDLDDNDLDALEKRSSYEADEDEEDDDDDFDFLVRRALGDYDDDDEDEDFDDFSKRSLDDFDADEDDDDDDDYLAKRDLSDEDFEDEDEEDFLNKRSTGDYAAYGDDDEDDDFDDFSKRSLGDIEEAEQMYNEYTENGDNEDDDDDEKRSLDGEDDIEALDMTGYINMVKRAIGEDGDDELNGAIDMTPYISEVKASGNSQYAGV